MKKLITFSLAFMLAVLFNTNAIAQTLSHTVYPAEGCVTEISEISVVFDAETNWTGFNPETTGIFDSNGNNLINNPASEFSRNYNERNRITFKPSNGTITTPGTYIFKMAANSVSTGMSASASGTKNAEITIYYRIPMSHTIEPAGGKVSEISEISVVFDTETNWTGFDKATTGIFKDGVNYINEPKNEFHRDYNQRNRITFRPTNGTITEPGVYTFRIPAGAISTGSNASSGLINGDIEVDYTIEAEPLVPGEAVTPTVGSKVMDLSTITIPFAEPAEVVQDKVANVTLGGQPVDKVTMSDDGLTATITSSYKDFNAGNVTLSIPKGLFRKQNSSSVNAALSYSWNVVEVSLGITAPEFIFKGKVENVKLELTNGISFAGFQLDMVLPEGLTVEPIAGAECDFVLSSRADGHIIDDGVVEGKIRLLSYGKQAQEYTGNEGPLVTFAVKAEDNFKGGNIAISNIKFADRNGVKYLLADVASKEIESRTYVSSITIAPTALNLETNQEATVTAAVAPEAAFDKTYLWSSSNTEYVTVDENGLVKAIKPTEAENPVYIIATAQDGSNVKAEIPVTVVFTHATALTIDPATVSFEVNDRQTLTATFDKETNKAGDIVWTSSNREVAEIVITEGVVEVVGKAIGETTVIAQLKNGNEVVFEKTIPVKVDATLATSVTVSPKVVKLEIGGTYSTYTLTATVDEPATNKEVVWSVESGEEYVSIHPETGVVTAKAVTPAEAPAVVKATTVDGSNKSDTAQVIVLATLATNVEVALVEGYNTTELKDTEFVELKATLTGETTKPIVWTAVPEGRVNIEVNAETGVAKVTANETVGEVTVYATVENTNVQGSIVLNIVKTPVETIDINYEGVTTFETGAESFELTATILPELATNKTYAWSTTDVDIAYVDENNQVVFGQKTGEVTLTATANDNAEVYDSLTFNVVYTLADEIVITSDSADNTLKAGESLTLTATADTNKEIRWSAVPEGCVEITVDPVTGAATVTALKYVEDDVTIKAQIFEGETPVVTAEQKITLEITRGDVNNDATVNIVDVTVTAAYILGQEVNTFIFAAADLDNDQVIDIADIVRLVRLILDQEPTPEQQAIINRARRFADSSNSLSIEDFEINEGETKQIAIKLDNSKAFSAFQADIYLPEGLEFVDGALSARQSADHVMASTVREDGSVRMLSYSMNLDTYSGSEGDFIYLTVKAEEGFVGDFQIEIDNIVFVQADQSASYFQPVVANVNGVETTGIEDVEGDEFKVKVVGNTIVAPEGAEVYDLNGLRVDAENLAKGIYIVKVGNQIVKVII